MLKKHPIIAVTGSSGAGTSSVKIAMQKIYRRNGYKAIIVEGDSFHKYNREEMLVEIKKAAEESRNLSHFGPEGNEFEMLADFFTQYSETGTGKIRKYLHNEEEAEPYHQKPGTFTPYEDIEGGSDLLFYEGLHGGVKHGDIDIGKQVDLLIGITPIVNLEWIQKIHRDSSERGYSTQSITETILRRMSDYVHYMMPQFTHTHINFQRVPTVDTSNPFIARDVPTADESFVVIRFGTKLWKQIDYCYLLKMLHGSFMSRKNTIVVPGGKMALAVEMIVEPLVINLITKGKLEWSWPTKTV